MLTNYEFKRALQECREYAESKSDEEYFFQAAEVLEMLIEGVE